MFRLPTDHHSFLESKSTKASEENYIINDVKIKCAGLRQRRKIILIMQKVLCFHPLTVSKLDLKIFQAYYMNQLSLQVIFHFR